MKITILHNPRCSKSRTALTEICAVNPDVEIIEYLKDTPTVAQLKDLIARLGIKPHDLIRTKEPLYKETFEGKKLTDLQWMKVMHENPVLIERPILIKGKKVVIGRSQEEIDKILK